MKLLSFLTVSLALAGAMSARADASAAPAVPSAEIPEVNHYVYLSFLPEPSELMADAKANGLTILRLDKTADKVVVSYRYPDGHEATLGYALLSAAGQADRLAETRRVTPVAVPEPEVVYYESRYPTRVVYRDAYWDDFWPPLVLGLGLGWATSGHGHYHGGWHGHGHGGWRH